MELITLTKLEVPRYLHASEYFLDLKEGAEFTVAKKFLKPNATVDSCESLHHIVETIGFWGLRKVPCNVLQFLMAEAKNPEEAEQICTVLLQFDAELPLLQAVQFLQKCSKDKDREVVIAHFERRQTQSCFGQDCR